MGVADYLVTSTVNGVLAQRPRAPPVRALPDRRIGPLPEMIQQMGVAVEGLGDDITLYQPQGCEACHGVGFSRPHRDHRSPDHDRSRCAASCSSVRMRASCSAAAVEGGMRTMHADGVLKALAGITTLAEVMRVTRET